MNDPLRRLLLQLQEEDPEIRCGAVEGLMGLGEEARPAAAALARASGDEAEEVREAAAGCLEELGPPLPEQVADLIEVLAASNPDGAYWAATLLGRLEDRAGPAVPALIAALTGRGEPQVRQRAAWALGRIGPNAKAAANALRHAAEEGDARLARLAKEALDHIAAGA